MHCSQKFKVSYKTHKNRTFLLFIPFLCRIMKILKTVNRMWMKADGGCALRFEYGDLDRIGNLKTDDDVGPRLCGPALLKLLFPPLSFPPFPALCLFCATIIRSLARRKTRNRQAGFRIVLWKAQGFCRRAFHAHFPCRFLLLPTWKFTVFRLCRLDKPQKRA